MRKTKKQLEAELEAANKRCAELADAPVKAVQAQPVYVPYWAPVAAPQPISPRPVYPWGEIIVTCNADVPIVPNVGINTYGFRGVQ